MQVRATRKGYYGHKVIEVGEVFVVKDDEQAGWFVPVNVPASPSTVKKAVTKNTTKMPRKVVS